MNYCYGFTPGYFQVIVVQWLAKISGRQPQLKLLPSDGFYTWVKFQQIWNVEFNTFDDFLYIQACDLGYLDQISQTCSRTQNILKQV